jgi:hypothetical protein
VHKNFHVLCSSVLSEWAYSGFGSILVVILGLTAWGGTSTGPASRLGPGLGLLLAFVFPIRVRLGTVQIHAKALFSCMHFESDIPPPQWNMAPDPACCNQACPEMRLLYLGQLKLPAANLPKDMPLVPHFSSASLPPPNC